MAKAASPARRRWPACWRSWRASRRRRRCGKPICCRRGCATTRRPGWTNCAAPDARCGRACARQRPVRSARGRCVARRSCCCRGAAPRSGRAWRLRRSSRARSVRARKRSPITWGRTAPRSSTRSPMRRGCCPPNWKRRWPSWSPQAASTATATPACARCWCRHRSGRRHWRGAGAGCRCTASRMRGAGRCCALLRMPATPRRTASRSNTWREPCRAVTA